MQFAKEILKQFGESTAYSAKCHFKSADIRRILMFALLLINICFSIVTLTDVLPAAYVKILSIGALIGSVVLIMLDTRNGMQICPIHMKFGNLYLALHNDIYVKFMQNNVTPEEIDSLKNRLNELNCVERPEIPGLAKFLATRAIEKKKE
jgi:hypothetical protein